MSRVLSVPNTHLLGPVGVRDTSSCMSTDVQSDLLRPNLSTKKKERQSVPVSSIRPRSLFWVLSWLGRCHLDLEGIILYPVLFQQSLLPGPPRDNPTVLVLVPVPEDVTLSSNTTPVLSVHERVVQCLSLYPLISTFSDGPFNPVTSKRRFPTDSTPSSPKVNHREEFSSGTSRISSDQRTPYPLLSCCQTRTAPLPVQQ